MRLPGRRKSSPPPRKPPLTLSAALRPLGILLVILITVLLVVSTLPQSNQYAQMHFAKQNMLDHDRLVKGIVVSHGFLKISVDVAYKVKDDASEATTTQVSKPGVSSEAKHKNTPKPIVFETLSPSSPSQKQSENVAANISQPKSHKSLNASLDQAMPHTKIPKFKPALAANSSGKPEPGDRSSPEAVPLPPPLPPPVESLPAARLDPLMIKQRSKEDIIVDVIFHRVQAPDPGSLLSCRLSDSDVQLALEEATNVWKNQAKILLRFTAHSVEYEKVSLEAQHSFEEHLGRFPKNDETGQPWTTENPGRIGLVGSDLIQILSPESQKRWLTVNPINVYCIGAFVGYNGVTWSRHVFIRSLKYHQTDVEMDVATFTRILAHEIGHVLSLPHPGIEVCALPCDVSTCNLMCQQRSLPSTANARQARALTPIQVARARTAAALLDIFDTFSLQPPDLLTRRYGIPTETVANTKASKSQLIFLPKPLSMNATLSVPRISFALSKLKLSCTVAIVIGKVQQLETNKDIVISTRIRALGSFANTIVVKPGISRLVFPEIDPTMWTNARHIELDIVPPISLRPGQHIGLAFSSPGISIQLQKRPENELLHVPKIPVTLFSSTKSVVVDAKAERTSGVGPIFSVVVTETM